MFVFEKQSHMISMSDTSMAEWYQDENILPYVIKTQANNQIIGYLFAEKTDVHTLYIQFIEILDDLKESGWGTKVVRSIFTAFNVTYLEGMSLIDDGGRAYYFWLSLGAEMSVDAEIYEDGKYVDVEFVLELPVEHYLPGVVIEKEKSLI